MRRHAVLTVLLAILALVAPARAGYPVSGEALPGLGPFDKAVVQLLERWRIPGASLAVAKDGRLVLAKAYGYADISQAKPATPDLRFRVASLSKSLTAAAVMRLVEERRLDLDDRMMTILGEWAPAAEAIADPRVYDITVRHLLMHRGGWNRDQSGDPSFDSRDHLADPNCRGIMRDELTRVLDFTPGSTFSYSNTGYCILGRIIERITGLSYGAYVAQAILKPAAADRMALTRRDRFPANEPIYYQTPGSAVSPYDGIALDAIDSLAGWVARPVDYLRYFLALNGCCGRSILQPETVSIMTAAPSAPKRPSNWYGLGIRVQARSGGLDLWHHGSMPGSQAEVVLAKDGFGWVVAFNARPLDAAAFSDDIDATLWAAARQVSAWPNGDLFD